MKREFVKETMEMEMEMEFCFNFLLPISLLASKMFMLISPMLVLYILFIHKFFFFLEINNHPLLVLRIRHCKRQSLALEL